MSVTLAVEQYQRPLTAYALRLTGHAETARDVVQETFLRLQREAAEHNGHLRQWLYTVCRRCALDARRKERRMGRRGSSGGDDATDGARSGEPVDLRGRDPATLAESRDTGCHLVAHVDGLPEQQREVIRLRFEHELCYREIAAVTGLSVSYVGYLIHTAIRTLRERMKVNES